MFTNGNSDWKLAPTTICTPHSIFIFSSSSVTVCIALNSILSLFLSLSPDFTQLSPVHIDTQPHKHFTSALRPFFPETVALSALIGNIIIIIIQMRYFASFSDSFQNTILSNAYILSLIFL